MRTLGKEFYHLICSPYGVRCSLLPCDSSQLVFGRDAILNINYEANWQLIKQRKQVLINKGNQKENCCRQSHVYRTVDKVLSKNARKTKFYPDAYIGPYTLTKVWNNGAVHAHRGNVTDTYDLLTIFPFKE